jgi:hypothetical protein
MNKASTIEGRWQKTFLFVLKGYILFGAFSLFPLIRLIGFDGNMAINFLTIGYIVSLVIFAAAGIAQTSAGAHKYERSSFIFAIGALIWIIFFKLILPRLAST